MGSQNKLQAYPYSLKTVAMMNQQMCANRAFAYIVPPKDALTIERLYTHFVMQFAVAISAADQVLLSLGIIDQYLPAIGADAHYQRRITLNKAADGSRRVDVSMDLTHLLKNTNVAYTESGDTGNGYTMVEILLPTTLQSTGSTGTIELWKIDALYTTTGIR